MGKEHNIWKFSTNRGKAAEDYVIDELLPSIGLKVTRNNTRDVKAVDALVGDIPVDVKIAFTPYPSDRTPAGLTSGEHLTVDYPNIMKYSRRTLLLFLVRYEEPQILLISAGKIRDIIARDPSRIYMRSKRSFKDKEKKIGISMKECRNITRYFPANVIDKIHDIP